MRILPYYILVTGICLLFYIAQTSTQRNQDEQMINDLWKQSWHGNPLKITEESWENYKKRLNQIHRTIECIQPTWWIDSYIIVQTTSCDNEVKDRQVYLCGRLFDEYGQEMDGCSFGKCKPIEEWYDLNVYGWDGANSKAMKTDMSLPEKLKGCW